MNKMNKMNKKYRLFTLTLSIAALMIFSSSVFAQENARESPSRHTGKLMPCPAPVSNPGSTQGMSSGDRIVPGGQSNPMNPNEQGGSTTPQAGKAIRGKVKTISIGGARIIQSGCDETVVAEPGDFLTFRWTPIDATPTEPVTYRLKVWQLMQGQNGTAAMRSNQPIITKDVDNVDHFTVESSILGPCKPPYMCDFVWEVQSGSPTGKLVGKPQIGSFKYDLKMMK